MRIGIYVAELDIKGGTHKQVLRLAEFLQDSGHDVVVITPIYVADKTFSGFKHLNIVALRHRSGSKNLLIRVVRHANVWKLALKMGRVDVLNIHDNRGIFFFVSVWLLRMAKGTVWQINDLHPAFGVGAATGRHRRPVDVALQAANRWMAKKVDAITVNVSKNIGRVREYLGVTPTLYYCGVDFPVETQYPKMPAPPQYRVMSTGVFFRYRNYERLIDGCAVAQNLLGNEVALTIVGDYRNNEIYAQEIREHATRMKINLTIKQNLSEQELLNELSNSDVFAFVNIDQSWGLAVFEAAASAKPVVLSESVGATELVTGKPGFVIADPLSKEAIGESLFSLLRDPDRCAAMGAAALNTVRAMSWSAMYCRPVEELLCSTVKGNSEQADAIN